MEAMTEAPPVVAVVVTRDPGPWFEEALAALGAQDYPAMSVLVIDAGSREELAPRVAMALPSAFVRRLDADPGYGAAADEVLTIVQGASHLLFCHDDVAPDADVTRLLIEEAFRENAGIVAPKLVEWDDPDRLQALGRSADRVGTAVDLVDRGELDQGQRDTVREVFVAPSACFMVRADLFARLGGFDPAIGLPGTDLDLCWRARVAGARVVTAPAARVRHRAATTGGDRTSPGGRDTDLEPRARLRTLLVVTPTIRLPVTVATAAARTVLEAVLALALRRPGRARVAAGAWSWNLRQLASIRAARRRLRPLRSVPDRQVRATMRTGGSLSALVNDVAAAEAGGRSLGTVGRDALGWWRAGGLRRLSTVVLATAAVLLVGTRHLLGRPIPGVGTLAPPPHSAGTLLRVYASGWRIAGLGGSHPLSPAFALLGLAGEVFLGKTGLLWSTVVLGSVVVGIVGAYRLARPVGSWRASAAAVITYASVALPYDALARGRLSGLVLYAAAPFVLLRLLRATGLAPFGAEAATEEAPPPPPGPAGSRPPGDRPDGGEHAGDAPHRSGAAARLFDRPRHPPAPVPGADAVGGLRQAPASGAGGDDTLVLERPPPDNEDRASGDTLTEVGQQHALDEIGAFDEMVDLDDLVRTTVATRRARRVTAAEPVSVPVPVRSVLSQVVGLALLVAVAAALAPEALPVTAVMAGALALSGLVSGPVDRMGRAGFVGATAVGGAALLLAPWSLDLLRSHRWTGLVGVGPSTRNAPAVADLLRFSTGPTRTSVLGFALLVAAFLPLLLGRSWRLGWAARLWVVALVCIALAWAMGRGWLVVAPIQAGALLAPAAAALSLSVALGVAAFEVDLPGYRFGWRQLASAVAAVAVAVGTLPIVVAATNGRWHAPARDHASVLSWMPDTAAEGPFRVLWLGAPEVLPLTGNRLSNGLVYATSVNGPPDALAEWAGPVRAADAPLARAVTAARDAQTTGLGRLLAPMGVRYVVVASKAAPAGNGAITRSVPADLPPALSAQLDLRQIESDPSLLVYENAAWAPMRSQLPVDAVEASRSGDPLDARTVQLSGASSVLAPTRDGSQRYMGPVDAGRVLLAEAPASQWSLRVGGVNASRQRAFGSVLAVDVATAGRGVLHYRTPLGHTLALWVQLLLWLAAIALVVRGRRPGRRASERSMVDAGTKAATRPAPSAVKLVAGQSSPAGAATLMQAASSPRSQVTGPASLPERPASPASPLSAGSPSPSSTTPPTTSGSDPEATSAAPGPPTSLSPVPPAVVVEPLPGDHPIVGRPWAEDTEDAGLADDPATRDLGADDDDTGAFPPPPELPARHRRVKRTRGRAIRLGDEPPEERR